MILFSFSSIVFSLLLGSMIFFVSVVSPSAFKSLKPKYSSKFLRIVFPRFFTFGIILSFVSALLTYLEGLKINFIFSIFIGFGFIFNNYVLTPLINTQRDYMLSGVKNSERAFKILHTLSVLIFIFLRLDAERKKVLR